MLEVGLPQQTKIVAPLERGGSLGQVRPVYKLIADLGIAELRVCREYHRANQRDPQQQRWDEPSHDQPAHQVSNEHH